MATTLISDIDDIVFSADLEVIQMTSDSSPVTVTVCDSSGAALMSTNLYPLSNGSVTLYDIAKLIDNSLGDSPAGLFSVRAQGAAICTMTVIRSAVKLSLPASEWISSRFLTSMTEERDTASGRLETLSCYNPTGKACTADCIYIGSDGLLAHASVTVPVAETVGDVKTYDVSPHKFARTGYELVHYTVKAGGMTQRYRVILSPLPVGQSFIFRNNFGCWETLHCVGEITSDPQFSRQTYMVNGRFEAYDVGETDSTTASTGVMRFGSERLVRDFARSKDTYLLNSDGSRGERIVVNDCTVRATNADDFNPQFSFTYRLSHKGAADLDGFRVFDNTFDATYE